MEQLLTLLSWLCLAAGSFIVLVTGYGLLRLPTFYARVHAASLTDTLGAGLILLGMALQAGWSMVTVKLALVVVFLVLTGPAAAHALAKAAYLHGLDPNPRERDGAAQRRQEVDHSRAD